MALRPPALLLSLLLLLLVEGSYGASFQCDGNILQLKVGTVTYDLTTCGAGTTCDAVSGSCKEIGDGQTIENFLCPTGLTSEKTFSYLGNCGGFVTCSTSTPPTASFQKCKEDNTQYYHLLNTCIPTAAFKKIVGDCYMGERNCRRSDVASYREPNPADPREMVVCINGTIVTVVGCSTLYNPSTGGCV